MKTFDDIPDERYLTMRLTYQKHTVRCPYKGPSSQYTQPSRDIQPGCLKTPGPQNPCLRWPTLSPQVSS
jgi:hypothetical protein